jgi:hypothetical protein
MNHFCSAVAYNRLYRLAATKVGAGVDALTVLPAPTFGVGRRSRGF